MNRSLYAICSVLFALFFLTRADAATVSGTVSALATGLPIANAEIDIRRNGVLTTSITSGVDGSYSIASPFPSPGDALSIEVSASGYQDLDQAFDGTPSAVHLDIALREATSISGHVHMPDGAPASGVLVTAAYYANGSWVPTDSATENDGSYIIDSLVSTSYRVCVNTHAGTIVQCFDHANQPSTASEPAFTPIVLSDGEHRTGVDFDLTSGGAVSGRLIDGRTSNPLGDYSVLLHFYNTNGEEFENVPTTTTADGRYHASGVPNGGFYVSVESMGPFSDHDQLYPNVPCDFNGCVPTKGQLLTMSGGNEVTDIDFNFHPDSLIRGRVTDATTGNGIAGAVVKAYYPKLTPVGIVYEVQWTAVSQGTAGSYELYVSGPSTFYVSSENIAPHINTIYPNVTCTLPLDQCLSNGTPIAVFPGDTIENIDIASPLGVAMTGTVTQIVSGTPLQAQIYVFDQNSNVIWTGLTDNNGAYSSDGWPGGTYYAFARIGNGACSAYLDRPCPDADAPISSVSPTPIVLQSGEVRAGIDFHIDPDRIFAGSFDSSSRTIKPVILDR